MIGVLVVDDHTAVRRGIAGLLDAEPDLAVLGTAADGAEALVEAARLGPDVVLMDVGMPVMDGITAAQLLHSEHPRMRVLVVSSAAAGETVHAARDAGVAGYMLKSDDPANLAAAVRVLAGGGEWWCPQAVEALRHAL